MSPDRNPGVPRDRSWLESVVTKFCDFFSFSKRSFTPEEKEQPEVKEAIAQHSRNQKNLLSCEGIRLYSPIFDFFSTSLPFCFPLDAMHLFLENACKRMFSFFYDRQTPSLLPRGDMTILKETIGRTKGMSGWCSDRLDPEKFTEKESFGGMRSNQFRDLLDLFPVLYMELKLSRDTLLGSLLLGTLCIALMAMEIVAAFLPTYHEMINMTIHRYKQIFVGSATDNRKFSNLNIHSFTRVAEMIKQTDSVRSFWSFGQERSHQWLRKTVRNNRYLFLSIQNLIPQHYLFSWLFPLERGIVFGCKTLRGTSKIHDDKQKKVKEVADRSVIGFF